MTANDDGRCGLGLRRPFALGAPEKAAYVRRILGFPYVKKAKAAEWSQRLSRWLCDEYPQKSPDHHGTDRPSAGQPAPEIRHAAWRLLAASRFAALTPRCPKISPQTVRPAPMSPMKLICSSKKKPPMRIAAKGVR